MLALSLDTELDTAPALEPVRIRVKEKGRVVLPIQFREAVGIKVGDVVNLEMIDNELRISTFRSRLEKAQRRAQRLVPAGGSVVAELIAERRAAAVREEEETQHWLAGGAPKRTRG